MNLDTQNSSKPRSHRSLNPKKYAKSETVDKENIEKENKMPVIDTTRKVTSSPRNTRNTRSFDNNYDRSVRPRGLQELDATNSQGVIAKRSTQSSSDTNPTKPFSRTRFSIYNDTKNNEDTKSTTKQPHYKSKESEKLLKVSCLREAVLNEITSKENDKKSDEKLAASMTYVVSPKNLPNIPKVNVFKIKEEHKKASSTRKMPKVIYEVLSLELAYNIDYMYEYVRFQMEISEKKRLCPVFLTKGISVDQRRLIVKYLLCSTSYHKYPSFILYQAVKIFDSYINAIEVALNELQTVALAALWIALKKDLIIDDVPEASTIIKLAGTAFQGNKKPLFECEKKILMTLNFEISFAEPFSMLALYTVMIDEVRDLASMKVQELYYCGSYLVNRCIYFHEI
ncbi:PREDICTED: uncharacterized protein LOC105361837 [Ceratosolen solmsi marchali]|uniref:Uncharacterized protein LOC105361837 n=1 Tax=Ceratosolen solmsi marchali TaxID=326594 RepID=A0AAJ6YG41_9HYME|nr:PREDICTED: uncharacterized protein LOC105361837 [Ceratosolen solmsi marchali]